MIYKFYIKIYKFSDFDLINSFNQNSSFKYFFYLQNQSWQYRVIPIEKVNGKLGTSRYKLRFYAWIKILRII